MQKAVAGMMSDSKERFSEGMAGYIWRYRQYHPNLPIASKVEIVPDFQLANKWEDYKDKKVFVLSEQGLGDNLMFSLVYPTLADYADKVTIMIDDPVYDVIVERFPHPDIEYVKRSVIRSYWAKTPDEIIIQELNELYDIQTLVGDVFAFHYVKYGYIPKSELVLEMPKEGKIGIAPLPDPKGERYKEKIIPYHKFKPYDNKILLSRWEQGHPKIPKDLEYGIQEGFTFKDTLEEIKKCQCIIAADTSVAHLAGLTGVKCYVIVTDWYDWRWKHLDLYSSTEIVNVKDLPKLLKHLERKT
jgi:hypothetical protein